MRVVRLIQKWLNAGVLEDGKRIRVEEGTPQGGSASPLLANVMNQPALFLFRFQVGWLWHRALSRRSQNGRILWDRMRRLITRWLPLPTVCHPYPLRRMGVLT